MALQVTPPLQEMRILLADDNRTNRKVTLAQLRTLGFFAADAVETGLDRSRAASVIYVHLRNQSGSPFGHVRQAPANIQDSRRHRLYYLCEAEARNLSS